MDAKLVDLNRLIMSPELHSSYGHNSDSICNDCMQAAKCSSDHEVPAVSILKIDSNLIDLNRVLNSAEFLILQIWPM